MSWKKKIEDEIEDLRKTYDPFNEETAKLLSDLRDVALAANSHRLYLKVSGKRVPERLERSLKKLTGQDA